MNPLRKWMLSLAATATAVVICYAFVDRPVALIFHHTIAKRDTFAALTTAPDPMVPLAAVVFVALGLVSLSGRTLSRFQNCVLHCSLSLIVAELTKESAVGPKGYMLRLGLVAAPTPVRARSQMAARNLSPLNLASIK